MFEPGEEYTPPTYRAVALPYLLGKARAALFGTSPDRRAVIYRVRQLLACVHASALAEHALLADPRITYLPLARGGFELPCGVSMTSASGLMLGVTGTPPLPGPDGKTALSWVVAISGDGGLVTVTTPGWPATTQALVYTGGLAAPISLPGGGTLAVRPPFGSGGLTWRVTCLLPPPFGLAEAAMRLGNAGADTHAALFGVAAAGPQGTWKNVWESRQPLPDRLAAASLALAYRTDLLRDGLA